MQMTVCAIFTSPGDFWWIEPIGREVRVAVLLEVHPVGYAAVGREEESLAVEPHDIGRMEIDVVDIQAVHCSRRLNLVITRDLSLIKSLLPCLPPFVSLSLERLFALPCLLPPCDDFLAGVAFVSCCRCHIFLRFNV